MKGKILRLVRNRGFGFLVGDDKIERFFHFSSVSRNVNVDNLAEDDRITFEEDRSPRGPRAKNIDIDVFAVRNDDPQTQATSPQPKTAEANGNQKTRRQTAARVYPPDETEDGGRARRYRGNPQKGFRARERRL